MDGTGCEKPTSDRRVSFDASTSFMPFKGRRCFYCREWIAFLKLSTDLHCATVDHFVPLALGGRDNISNVVLACVLCNRRKADRAPTIPELLQWNELAKAWPHIQPVSLALHAPKAVRSL